MPCYPIKIGDHVGVICVRGPARKQKPCQYCGKPAPYLCDFPLGRGKTCDASICRACSAHVGPDTDYCKVHNQATVKSGVNPRPVFGVKP